MRLELSTGLRSSKRGVCAELPAARRRIQMVGTVRVPHRRTNLGTEYVAKRTVADVVSCVSNVEVGIVTERLISAE